MKKIYNVCFSVCVLIACSPCGYAEDIENEALLISQFQTLWMEGDDELLPQAIEQLSIHGGTNAVNVLLPHLDYNPAISKANRSPNSNAVVQMTGYRYVVAEAIRKIGLTLEQCISELETSTPESQRERLLAEIGVSNHGWTFTSNMIHRASNDGGKWLHVEHLCIPITTVATNASWPVSMSLEQTDSGLSVSISNHLASALSFPGTPPSRHWNTLLVYTDPERPWIHKQVGVGSPGFISEHPEQWFLTIPSHEVRSFHISWNDIANNSMEGLWDHVWQIQWEIRDDLYHGFLSNPIPITSLPIHN